MENRKIVVAHRGDHTRAHENTLEAAQSAIDCGADMMEFDVRRCGDGALVVHHDEQIGAQLLANASFAQALRLADGRGYRLARLEEMLELTAGKIRLDVELKEGGYEDTVLRCLFDHLRPEDFLITSFDTEALARLRAARPEVRTGILISDVSGARALEMFLGSGTDFLAPDDAILDGPTLAEAAKFQIPLLPWTVNDPDAIRRRLLEPAVFGIITDTPAEALRIRNAEAPHSFIGSLFQKT